MSNEILVFLAIVLLLKELGVIQAIKRFFNEESKEAEKDEESEEESTEESIEDETEEDESFNEEKVNKINEENTGLKVDSNVEEASEESFEDIECSDKESVKKVKPLDESEKRTTLSDPKVIPRVFMKNEHTTPQPDPNKKTSDFKPLEQMKAEPTRVVKNEYPRVTFIDKNTAKLEESPNDVFYCMTQDMPKIRMMPEKEQIKQLRMMKSHIYPLQMDDDFIINPFLL